MSDRSSRRAEAKGQGRAGAPGLCFHLAGTPICPGSGFQTTVAFGWVLLSWSELREGQGGAVLVQRSGGEGGNGGDT